MLECCSGGGLFRPAGVGDRRRGKTAAPIKTLSGRILLPTDGSYCFDPYQLLQVRRDATDREITAGYRRFALLYHPARRQSSLSTSAHELDNEDDDGFLFSAVAAAYETLMDDEARHALHQILADYHDDESRAGADDGTLSSFDRSEARDERGFSTKKNATNNDDPREGSSLPTATTNQKDIRSLLSLFPPRSTAATTTTATTTTAAASSMMILQAASSSSTTPADTHHYSHEVSERLFGGPLKLMHQARRFEGFTDPYVIFERVFGSSLLVRTTTRQQSGDGEPVKNKEEGQQPRETIRPPRQQQQPSMRAPRLPHHLEPYHQPRILDNNNGTAFRQLGNRRLTRTIQKRWGDHCTHIITVTSERLDETTTTTTTTRERRDDDTEGEGEDDPWLPSLFCCS
jgi:hypothetical protein